jgi:hypothetical protein
MSETFVTYERWKNLNEMNFQKKMDNPLSAMGIGRRQLVKNWLDEMGVKHYTINDDFTIDADSVYLEDRNLIEFPNFIQFNKINKYFNCNDNKLTSLRGCPTSVGASFHCSYNQLISLKGCPKKVGLYFYCTDNIGTKFTKEYVKKLCNVKGRHILLSSVDYGNY